MPRHGFVRVAAAVPQLKLADTRANAVRTIDLMYKAADEAVDVVVFPEMGLTGYTCNDLFHQRDVAGWRGRCAESRLTSVGSDLRRAGDRRPAAGRRRSGLQLRRRHVTAATCWASCRSRTCRLTRSSTTLACSPRRRRRTAQASACSVAMSRSAPICCFDGANVDDLVVGVEICEDLWGPMPPSSLQALHGATILANLSASNEIDRQGDLSPSLVVQQSARCIAGYVYTSCGAG